MGKSNMLKNVIAFVIHILCYHQLISRPTKSVPKTIKPVFGQSLGFQSEKHSLIITHKHNHLQFLNQSWWICLKYMVWTMRRRQSTYFSPFKQEAQWIMNLLLPGNSTKTSALGNCRTEGCKKNKNKSSLNVNAKIQQK